MNLYGHAVVAAWRSPDPWHGLGSMLPDLTGLAGARPPTPLSEALRAGIALHHATDATFHATPAFVALSSHALEVLQRDGVPRGPARAVAHVGIELLLDGELAGDAPGLACFEASLALAHGSADAALTWAREGDGERVRFVAARLAQASIPQAYRDPDAVAERLFRILARRPRLALAEAHVETVRRWARRVQPSVRSALPEILDALRAAPGP